jgi:activator of 2-hydroxyglutaryl-CoA dehydratase
MRDGIVVDFAMNPICAAGMLAFGIDKQCGSKLESRTLGSRSFKAEPRCISQGGALYLQRLI